MQKGNKRTTERKQGIYKNDEKNRINITRECTKESEKK